MNFALKIAILKSGRTQTEIAIESKMSEVRLSRIVRGYWQANKNEKQRLADILNEPVEKLFSEKTLSVVCND